MNALSITVVGTPRAYTAPPAVSVVFFEKTSSRSARLCSGVPAGVPIAPPNSALPPNSVTFSTVRAADPAKGLMRRPAPPASMTVLEDPAPRSVTGHLDASHAFAALPSGSGPLAST